MQSLYTFIKKLVSRTEQNCKKNAKTRIFSGTAKTKQQFMKKSIK